MLDLTRISNAFKLLFFIYLKLFINIFTETNNYKFLLFKLQLILSIGNKIVKIMRLLLRLSQDSVFVTFAKHIFSYNH